MQLMTVGTNQGEVFPSMVVSISINVMQLKDLWMFRISTAHAFFDESKFQKFAFGCCLRFCGSYQCEMVTTGARAEFPRMTSRRRCSDYFSTADTIFFDRSLEMLRLVIAMPRAVFRKIHPVISNLVCIATNCARVCGFNKSQCHAS